MIGWVGAHHVEGPVAEGEARRREIDGGGAQGEAWERCGYAQEESVNTIETLGRLALLVLERAATSRARN